MNNPYASEFTVLLAPMAGYTDVVFRALCRAFGCDLTYTEMISAKGLTFGNVKTGSTVGNPHYYSRKRESEQSVTLQVRGSVCISQQLVTSRD